MSSAILSPIGTMNPWNTSLMAFMGSVSASVMLSMGGIDIDSGDEFSSRSTRNSNYGENISHNVTKSVRSIKSNNIFRI